MRAFLLAGAAALALTGAAAAQSSTPGVIGSPQHSAQSGSTPMGGADVGRSGAVNMGANNQATSGTGSGNIGTNPGMMDSGSAMGSATRATPRDGHHAGARSSSPNRAAPSSTARGNDREPPATAAQLRREEARQTGQRAARATRPEDRAFMGGGVILENGRPVGMSDMAGSPSMPTNAMGGAMGAIQPGPAGRMGSGNNAGAAPGGGN